MSKAINIKISADSKELDAGLKNAQKNIGSFSQSLSSTNSSMAKMSAIGTTLGVIAGSTLTKAFQALGNSINSAISQTDALNNFPKMMASMGLSSETAQSAVSLLKDKLASLPTSLDDAVSAVQRFTAINSNISASTEMFLAVNNAIIASGSSAQMQSSALEQLSQAYAKGRIDMQDWKILLQAMPAQLKQVATAMGYVSSNDMYEAIQSGKATMNDFMATVVKLNKEGANGFASFADQASIATGGISASITILKKAFTDMASAIMNAIGQVNISGFITSIAKGIQTASNYIVAFVKIIKEAIAWLSVFFGGSGSTENLVKATASAGANLDSTAQSAENVSTGLDDATDSAKALSKQLAGFDEMTVLKDQSSSSSGSTSGGAGTITTDYTWDTTAITSGTDKVQEAFEKLKTFINKIFGKIDFTKLANSFKKLYNDIKKFTDPLKKILSDIWNKYLQPFITWTGNELLPSFLNALGGAISFIGNAISTAWNFLEPFITNFLKPIAEFTGGIIVSVLNGIGDALRAIGANEGAMNAIVGVITTLGIVLTTGAIAMKFQAISSAVGGVITTFSTFLQASGSVQVALMNTMASGTGLVSSIGAIASSFQALIVASAPLLIVVGAITAIATAIEFTKTKQMEAEEKTKTYLTTEQMAEQIAKNRANAIRDEVNALNELESASNAMQEANLKAINAEENLRQATANLQTASKENNMTTQEAIDWYNSLDGNFSTLNDSQLELAKTVGLYKDAQDRQIETTKNLATAKDELTGAEDRLHVAQVEQLRTSLDEQAQALITKGDYEGLATMLQTLADNEYEFIDAQGNNVKMSREDMAWLATGVADDVAQASKEWDSVWKNYPLSVRTSEDEIRNILGELKNNIQNNGIDLQNNSLDIGNNIGQGLVNGLNNKKNQVWNAGYALGKASIDGQKAGAQTHSPSKLAMQVGGFVGEGLELGMKKEEDAVFNMGEQLGAMAVAGLAPLADLALDIPDATVDVSSPITDTIKAIDDEANNIAGETDGEPVQLVVKIGEDTIMSKIIDGINSASALKNRSMINI